MAAKANDLLLSEVRDFTLNRRLAAPRTLVFRSFVETDRMKHWWAPRGFTMLSCTLDLREGGAWRMRIRSDETGAIQTEVGVYREIREPELLSFTQAWVRGNGTLTCSAFINSPPLSRTMNHSPRLATHRLFATCIKRNDRRPAARRGMAPRLRDRPFRPGKNPSWKGRA